MTKPITPDDVVAKQLVEIPDVVIEVWNKEIAKNWTGSRSTVWQKNILRELRIETDVSDEEILDAHWLDIEDIYRGAGWEVEYIKPGYNGSGERHFIFKRKS